MQPVQTLPIRQRKYRGTRSPRRSRSDGSPHRARLQAADRAAESLPPEAIGAIARYTGPTRKRKRRRLGRKPRHTSSLSAAPSKDPANRQQATPTAHRRRLFVSRGRLLPKRKRHAALRGKHRSWCEYSSSQRLLHSRSRQAFDAGQIAATERLAPAVPSYFEAIRRADFV